MKTAYVLVAVWGEYEDKDWQAIATAPTAASMRAEMEKVKAEAEKTWERVQKYKEEHQNDDDFDLGKKFKSYLMPHDYSWITNGMPGFYMTQVRAV